MVRQHGKSIRAYLGSRDVSADLASVDVKASAKVHERTTFADAGWVTYDAGLGEWQGTFSAFYQTNAGGSATSIERQVEALLGATGGILSLYDGLADGVGDAGILLSNAVLGDYSQPITVGDLVRISGSLKPAAATSSSTRPGLVGVLLHPDGTDSGVNTGASVDNSASSANGGRGTLHVLAATGTGGTVKVQHSTNNAVWADLVTFTAASAPTAETLEVAGTVNRYLRCVVTPDGASSLEVVCGFARY